MASEIRVGLNPPNSKLVIDFVRTRETIDEMFDAGITDIHVCDHVSFHGGIGFDALINAAALLAMHPEVTVSTTVYLLPLRHPVAVARQVSDLTRLAPGRFSFGVGIGGEEPEEYRSCGIDIATRGRRMNEALDILRYLLEGESVTFRGEFYDLDDVLVQPRVNDAVPVIVGGRSNAALRRTALHGDGWVGLWNSPKRFAAATEQIEKVAADFGRADIAWQHAMFVWCGLGDNAEQRLAQEMSGLYDLPFSAFSKYCPTGNAEQIAEFLMPYVEAGCHQFHLAAVSEDESERIAIAAEVKRLLNN